MKKNRLLVRADNILLLFHFLLLFFVCLPYSSNIIFRQIAEILPYINLIYIVLAGIRMWRDHNIRNVVFLVVTTLTVAFICIFNGSSMGSASAYLTLIFGMYYACTIGYNDSFIKIVSSVGIIYILISAVGSRNYFANWNMSGNSINPNTLAIVTLVFLFFINIDGLITHKARWKIVLINIIAAYDIWSYDSRACIFSLLVYYILILINSKNKKLGFRFWAILLVIAFTGGILFPLFYINTPQWLITLVTNLTHKTFYSGRQAIWARFFDTILNDRLAFIIGPGSHMERYFGEINLGSQTAYMSMHSSYLGIMLNFGLLGIILFFGVLILHINDLFKINRTGGTILSICIVSYITFLVVGYAEIILTNSYVVMAFNVFIGLANYYKNHTEVNNEADNYAI